MKLQTTRVGRFLIYSMRKSRRDEYQFEVMHGNEILFIGKTLEQAASWAERQERIRRVFIGMGTQP